MHLSSNRIENFEQFVILNFPETLKNFTAADNRFKLGWYMLELSSGKNIRMVNISNQYKTEEQYWAFLESTCNDSRSSEQVTNYSANHKIKNTFPNKGYMKSTKIWSCLEEYHKSLLTGRYVIFICFPKTLEALYYDKSSMGHSEFMDNTYLDFRSMKIFNGSSNLAVTLAGKIFSKDLSVLDVSNNMFVKVDPIVFRGTNLTYLNLSSNFLGEQIRTDATNFVGNQPYLQYFSLQNNRIHSIPQSFFGSYSNLKCLDLSQNALGSVTFSLDNLQQLDFLNLQNNEIRMLSHHHMTVLENIAKEKIENHEG